MTDPDTELAIGAQFENVIHVQTETDTFVMHGRPCELSAHAFVPPRRDHCPKDRNCYNSENERYADSTYDRLFHHRFDYNNKLHRCDREHAKSKGLTVNKEEKTKVVPTLSSSIYGHKLKEHLDDEIDKPGQKHKRVALVRAEFYRRNNINIQGTPQ